jgi:hypothetical protein
VEGCVVSVASEVFPLLTLDLADLSQNIPSYVPRTMNENTLVDGWALQ